MKSQILKRYETLGRIREFGAQQTEAFPEASLGRNLFAEVTKVVTELDTLAADRSSGFNTAMSSTNSKSTLREELRDDLRPLIAPPARWPTKRRAWIINFVCPAAWATKPC